MLEALSRCSMLCHGWAGGVRGCRGLSPAARNVVGPGEMRCDDLCTSADVGTLGERVERAYGDWLSAAVVGIVAWRCWGNDREKPSMAGNAGPRPLMVSHAPAGQRPLYGR